MHSISVDEPLLKNLLESRVEEVQPKPDESKQANEPLVFEEEGALIEFPATVSTEEMDETVEMLRTTSKMDYQERRRMNNLAMNKTEVN